ncbi:unnamed protein product [Microthlaspi erraticum]|uniref:Uncharacterized protein n=1 Tax=Microthlaspi erraticum TaxID=1685480 RepID=A0A6D2IR61_9BRAS|nr:unnamed protein product [Microthlaspi erraticum]
MREDQGLRSHVLRGLELRNHDLIGQELRLVQAPCVLDEESLQALFDEPLGRALKEGEDVASKARPGIGMEWVPQADFGTLVKNSVTEMTNSEGSRASQRRMVEGESSNARERRLKMQADLERMIKGWKSLMQRSMCTLRKSLRVRD